MKNARVWFCKDKQARFISHLDLNRCMIRAINASGIKIWHTEGFNPHPFVTFALPLPLGVRGVHESMDIRLLQEYHDIPERLNQYLPEGIRVYDVCDPMFRPIDIKYAKYQLELDIDKDILNDFFDRESIIITKKTKTSEKSINLKEYVQDVCINGNKYKSDILLYLPAGNTLNIAPGLLIKALLEFTKSKIFYSITKLEMFTEDKTVWR